MNAHTANSGSGCWRTQLTWRQAAVSGMCLVLLHNSLWLQFAIACLILTMSYIVLYLSVHS